MLASTILYIFVFLIFLAIFIEYRNDQKYQAKRDEERKRTTSKKPTEPIEDVLEKEKIPLEEPEPQVEEKPEIEEAPEVIEEVQPEAVEEVEPEPEVVPEEVVEEVQPEVVVEVEPEVEPEEVKETKELPECKYPPFTHVRLVEMGLSDDEAIEFVNELIPQLEEQVPLIENAINSADFHQIEKLTHGIKGSATNLGTGGVSDLLVEFNTYLKSEVDVDIVKAYHAHFIHYIEELKKQYTQGNL